jgi:ABC-type Na+ transport system ATPase subunit NatA
LSVPFTLKFNPEAKQHGRCVGIIGENGVGKTTMLGGMIESLINRNKEEAQEELPLFSSVMSICTTSFDCFADIKQEEETASLMPYYYFCANQNKDEDSDKIKESVKEIRERRFQNYLSSG